MKRRLALSVGALVAAVSFSSCSSVGSRDVVATVNGHDLTWVQLDTIVGTNSDGSKITDGSTVRAALTAWVQVVAVADDAGEINTLADLQAASEKVVTEFVDRLGGPGQAAYEKGLDGSPYLCLSAIPLGTAITGAQVMAELDAGTTFADAAKKYSTADTLAQSAGVVYSDQGVSCLDPTTFETTFPQIIGVLTNAGATVGTPVVVSDTSGELLLLLRPYTDLSLDEKRLMTQQEVGPALRAGYDTAAISINRRLGVWDPSLGQVVTLSQG